MQTFTTLLLLYACKTSWRFEAHRGLASLCAIMATAPLVMADQRIGTELEALLARLFY